MIGLGLRSRTTDDADILAFLDENGVPADPEPLPSFLTNAAAQVARDIGLPQNWLNNGPSQGDGGLYRLGLPDGLVSRSIQRIYGPKLDVFYISRLDQIFFKLYAAADNYGPTHISDLLALAPTDEELVSASKWAMTHDVSETFRNELKNLLKELGHEFAAQNI